MARIVKRFRLPLLLVAAALLIGGAAWTRFDEPSSPSDAAVRPAVTTTAGSTAASAPKKRHGKRAGKGSKATATSGPTTTVAANPDAYAAALFHDWTVRD